MLETSKDLFWIVLSFCILWFTIFICWGIYYIIMVFKNINNLVKEIKQKILMIEEFFANLKTKIEKSSNNVAALVNVGKQVIPYIKEHFAKKTGKKTGAKK
jgi:predicted PurR-regulated permease PerM